MACQDCKCKTTKTTQEQNNLSVVLHGKRDLRLEHRPVPEPRSNEVLLDIECVGICGTDVHLLKNGGIGNYAVENPVVLGHEASGVVVKLGKGVKNLSVGDRVAIEPAVPCRMCELCKKGKYNLCPDIKCGGMPPYHGSLTRKFVHAADFCHKLPDHVTLEDGVMLEPLAVGVHACKKAGVTAGSTVLILGAGPIGLVTLAVTKAMGASKIYITDLSDYRLSLAKEIGASKTIKVCKSISDEEAIKSVRNKMDNELVSITIDCTGFQQTMKMGIELTKSGGTFTIIGMAASHNVELPLFNALSREVQIIGVFRFANDYPDALSLISTGQVDLKRLITHRYKLEESLEAFGTAESGNGDPIKIIIQCKEASTGTCNIGFRL